MKTKSPRNNKLQPYLIDIRTRCEQCSDAFEAECGYRGCWLGYHPDGHQHPEKAFCTNTTKTPADDPAPLSRGSSINN